MDTHKRKTTSDISFTMKHECNIISGYTPSLKRVKHDLATAEKTSKENVMHIRTVENTHTNLTKSYDLVHNDHSFDKKNQSDKQEINTKDTQRNDRVTFCHKLAAKEENVIENLNLEDRECDIANTEESESEDGLSIGY